MARLVNCIAAAALACCAGRVAAQATSLTTQAQNGASSLGLLSHAPLPNFLPGPLNSGFPWGTRTAANTNPYNRTLTPQTGVTRYYQWTIQNVTLAPDGVQIGMLTVNGQFPGPLIEANWGDWIEVQVQNNLSEGTAMHWHGFLQTGTPYFDGTPGITQCPIAPGKSMTYRFRAELYGTTWYHAHYSAQYINGLAGPMVIHGPQSTPYDIDLGPIMLTDWFHGYYEDLVHQIQVANPFGPILPPQSNNMLINGKANYPCAKTHLTCTPNAGISKFRFQSGKRHLLRLINHGSEGVMFFSIDGYNMTVVANDLVPVEPYVTNLITLGVGQRTDVIVYGSGSPTSSVLMRLTDGPPGNIPTGGIQPAGKGGCNIGDGIKYTTFGGIYYENANTAVTPTTNSVINPVRYIAPAACFNDPLNMTVPVYKMPLLEPDVTLNLTVTGGYNDSGIFVWWMNNVTYLGDYNDPLLLEAKLGNTTYPPVRATYNLGNYQRVRVIINAISFPAAHPMHIHGHNFQVLASGTGVWDGKTITNPSNPQRRDTQLMGPYGYAVLQWELDNPGVWTFHCHIAWHISEGMNINIIEQEKALEYWVPFPMTSAQTCRDWWSWTNANVVNSIDSGL